MRRPVSIIIYLALAIAGFVVGVVGAFVQAVDRELVGVSVTYGVLVAIGAAVSLFWVARVVASSPRAGVIVAGLAWLAGVIPLGTGRPEGDVILPGGDLRSYAYLFLPTLAAAALATLPAPARSPEDAG